MHADSGHLQITRDGGFGVKLARISNRHSKFVFAQPCRNVRMSIGSNVWVNS